MAPFPFPWNNSKPLPPPPPPPLPPPSQPSSQESTPPPPPRSPLVLPTDWEYDVFVSFRGKDVRTSFMSFLFEALKDANIDCFRDNDPEGRGEKVSDEILGAIPRSKVAILVLSPRYSDSKWCLDELVEIMKHKGEHKIHDKGTILPVFFGVSSGDVKRQEGEFGKWFAEAKKGKTEDEIKDWKEALIKAEELGASHLKNECNWDQATLVHKVLDWLSALDIPDFYRGMGRGVVGRDQESEDVITLCTNIRQRKNACVVGIYGIQDIGKTRLAKLVFSRLCREFRYKGFLENDRSDGTTPEPVEERLLQILNTRNRNLRYETDGKMDVVNSKLRQKKALLVFDRVADKEKLEILLSERHRFAKGSIIIITARDERLLDDLEVDGRYMVSALTAKGSMQLFSRRVFGTVEPADGYKELSEILCHYTGGLPRALVKLSSHIKKSGEWEMTLEKLVRNPCVDCACSEPFKVGPFPQSRHCSDHFPFKKVGPFGGHDGEEWDDRRYTDVRQIDIVSGSGIESISIRYDDHGLPTGVLRHGESARGEPLPVKLDYPYEYLTSFSGYISTAENSKDVRISSITLQSNLQDYGPFGKPTESDRPFSFPARCGKIVGFYGRYLKRSLTSIGAHYELVSHIYPLRTLGPFGGENGEPWDDGKHSHIKQITVKYGSVINSIICEYSDPDMVMEHGGNGDHYKVIRLDGPDEYVTAMCGYISDETRSVVSKITGEKQPVVDSITEETWTVVNSITFQSNRRIWGPFGTEKGTFFSLPLNSGKIVGFYGRTDGYRLNSIGVHLEIYSTKQYPFKSVGLFGGGCGESWDDGRFTNIRQIMITVKDSAVKSLKLDYETGKRLPRSLSHGPNVEGQIHTITLGEDEYLTSFSGYNNDGGYCIRSLTFQSNKRTCGPYGVETGKYFSSPSTGGKIIGFYGKKSGSGLISIGAHFKQLSPFYPAKRIGPFGGKGGVRWGDENSAMVKQVQVQSDKSGILRVNALNEKKNGESFWSLGHPLEKSYKWNLETVKLDYPNEYLTSISGYIKDYADPIVVRSLIFQSNKRIYGPYGKKSKKGSYFWYPSTGGKIVSFFGYYSPSHLSSIGVYTEPISHLYPCPSVGPFGGHQGKQWDDGMFTGVRAIHVQYGSAIVEFSVEYDNNGSPVRCPGHGNDRSYMACGNIAEAKAGGGALRLAKRARLSPEDNLKFVLIKLDFPKEHLVSISGYTGKVYCEEVVLSLKVTTNLQSYHCGNKKGKYFRLPQEKNCGRIIGFHGTSGSSLQMLLHPTVPDLTTVDVVRFHLLPLSNKFPISVAASFHLAALSFSDVNLCSCLWKRRRKAVRLHPERLMDLTSWNPEGTNQLQQCLSMLHDGCKLLDAPKYQYLRRVMVRPLQGIVEFPRLFSYSPEGHIIPRHNVMVENRVDFELRYILTPTDEEFDQKVRAAVER